MLADAIKNRKTKKKVKKSNTEIDLGLEAYIPDNYIGDQEEKIEFYKKIKSASAADIVQIQDELIDRFGNYPKPVENLLAISALKSEADLAQVRNITKISANQIKIEFARAASDELKGPNIFKALEHVSFKAKISLTPSKRMVVLLELPTNINNRQLFNNLITFMTAASDIIQR